MRPSFERAPARATLRWMAVCAGSTLAAACGPHHSRSSGPGGDSGCADGVDCGGAPATEGRGGSGRGGSHSAAGSSGRGASGEAGTAGGGEGGAPDSSAGSPGAAGADCAAETDTAFCARLGTDCGRVTARDNCGARRAVECGSCTAPETCGASAPNVCGCTGETDAELCSALGAECGTVSAHDSCGVRRKDVACGACAPHQTCGLSTPNVCGISVELEATASDPKGNPLTYAWRVTEGEVDAQNAATTTWILPAGPGLHFAYVLVSNGKGGYVERRVAVSTDDVGTQPRPVASRAFVAPDGAAPVGNFFRSIIRTGYYAHDNGIYIPDAAVYLENTLTAAHTATATTDLHGYYTIPHVAPGDYEVWFDTGIGGLQDGGSVSVANEAYTDYYGGPVGGSVITGRALLSDGTSCGIDNEFFGVAATARASLLDSGGNVIAGPVRANRWGHFALPQLAESASVRVECEGGSPVVQPAVPQDYGVELEPAVFADSAAPVVSTMTAKLDGTNVGLFLPPPSGLPSDNLPGTDVFFTFKGIDSRRSACAYYRAIGAVESCGSDGTPSGAITFDDWKRAMHLDPYAKNGQKDVVATYVNTVDLNLTRNHHSISYGQNDTAAYVCNHLGPKDATQAALDTAIGNATEHKNLVACVAMDHHATPNVNGGQPFTRFLIFSPGGQLLPSINLDGRAEKFVPGVCVACHGGDKYAGRFPADGSGRADVGAHFLPYDVGNFGFSTAKGLSEAEQSEAIYQLNQNVLAAGPTAAAVELIQGWYASSHTLDRGYLPASWQGRSTVAVNFYHTVYAKNCRTCHVNFTEWLNLDHFTNIDDPSSPMNSGHTGLDISACGNFDSESFVRNFAMPNSLTTFNRYWGSVGTASDAPAALSAFLGELSTNSGPCVLTPSPHP